MTITDERKQFVTKMMIDPLLVSDYPDSSKRLAVVYSLFDWQQEKLQKGIEDCKSTWQIAKTNDEQQLVFGWASVAKDKTGKRPLDWQGDYVDAEVLEKAVYAFALDFREANEVHEGKTVGTVVESMMFTKEKMSQMGIPEGILPEGWWVGFKIEDAEAYAKVKSGVYKMFSIEGSASRVETPAEDTIDYSGGGFNA